MSDARDKNRRPSAVRTFLIADIRGYTRFTAQHGDEAASRLAGKFAELAGEGVEAWGGELVELRGDEALAVFDSPRQALRSAIELQDAFRHETDDEPELPLTVGIGVDAGEAVAVGEGFRGAALNRAARLCASAAAGEIVASADLVHLTGPMKDIKFRDLPDMELKGIDTPTAAMAVSESEPCTRRPSGIAAPAPAPALPAQLDPIVPLAGRQTEMRWLRWHWRRARHGDGRMVVLSGPSGIGKTRLAAELAAIAQGSGAAVRYVSSAGGDDSADLLSSSRGGTQLVVVDDLDAAGTGLQAAATDMAARAAETAALVILTHGEDAAPTFMTAVERLAPPERRLVLGPLDGDGLRAIAALYAGSKVEELPLRDLREQSGGVPAAIHRVAAQLASSVAARRLGASAEQTEAGRRDLRQSEEKLIGDVTDLELVRGRARRYEAAAERAEPSRAAICPYKGLATFEAVDAEYYFGRERLIAELVARLVGSRFLGLVGASGSGKSSVLRAGLMPALASGVLPGSDDWLQVLTRPGEHPLTELGQALERAGAGAKHQVAPQDLVSSALEHLQPGRQLLLIVDQFEELFTATQDEQERDAFIDLLTSGRDGVVVVAVLRADHYGHCAQYPALARLMGGSHVLVGPLTAPELAAVIEGPAERVGLRVESALVEELTVDAGAEPSVLPLLSTSLLELWQAREGGWLTLAAYRQGGGLRGSVARLAEAAFGELDPNQATIARSVFLRLAGMGEAEGAVRRRVPLAELDIDTNPLVGQVVDALTSARLLTIGDGYVEVAHEALLREWPRLQSWLSEDTAGRALRLHLIGAVREWEGRGRESADLYRGARLSAALDWAAERLVELNAAERQFLDESRLASERDEEKQRSANRRLRGLLAGAAGLLVLAVVAGGFAFTQANAARQREAEAESARGDAEAAASFARSRELAAASISVLGEDPTLSKLLAVTAASIVPADLEIESALHRAWAADMVIGRYEVAEDEPLEGLGTDLHPDGQLMVGSGGNFGRQPGGLLVVDLATNDVKWRYKPESASASVMGAYFSIDGTYVIAGVSWTPDEENGEAQPPPEDSVGVLILDAETGRLLKRLDTGQCGAHILAVSATSALISTASPADPEAPAQCSTTDGNTALETVDLTSAVVATLSARASGDGALSRDGRYAAFTDLEDERAVIIDLATSEHVLEIDPAPINQRTDGVRSLSADGSLLLYGDRPIVVIEVATGEIIATLAAGEGESIGTAFGPEGSTAYAAGSDATLRAWDALSGESLFVAPAAGGGRPSASLDGRVLVSDFATDTATLLDPASRGELGTFRGCNGFVPAGALEVVGDIAAFTTYCDDEGIYPTYIASLPDLAQLAVAPNADGQDLALSPDGGRFARQSGVGTTIGTVEIHDVHSGEVVLEMDGLCAWDYSYRDREEGGPLCKPFPDTPFALSNLALVFSPDGRFLAAVDDEFGYGAVWDAATGRLLHSMTDVGQALSITFTPDSAELIVSNHDGELIALSTESWQVTLRVKLDASVDGADWMGFAGFLEDGTLIGLSGFAGTGGGWLHRIDVSTFSVLSTVRAHDGAPKSMAMSPDGTLVVTGGADGVVRVWDGASGSLLHEFTVDGQAQGVAFVGDDRIAVTPQAGPLMIMAIDRQELLSSVRSTLTRGFTAEECARFNFGAECPTLEELRGEAP